MRQWMIDPRAMCRKHLLGEHVEHHMFAGAMVKGTAMTGYLANNLLEPMALQSRHDELVVEMLSRGYDHKSPMPALDLSSLPDIKIDQVAAHADLLGRCPECTQRAKDLK